LLLTARHCVYLLAPDGVTEAAATRVFIYFKDRNPSNPARGVEFEVERVPLEEDKSIDFAILRFNPPSPEYPALRFAQRKVARDEELFIIHHPRNEIQTLSRFNCRISGDGDSGAPERLVHLCNTDMGSSGSSVLLDNSLSPEIIGIHTASKINSGGTWIQIMTTTPALLAKSCIVRELQKDLSTNPLPKCKP
jgi:V8-like Glu-specific endopeptidase